jgi:hypothetical protein
LDRQSIRAQALNLATNSVASIRYFG